MSDKPCKSDDPESSAERPSCFYENKECIYYPCHTGLERINCLFCFCPLYTFDDCGGTYKMLNGIKDCSECLLPHKTENYGVVLRKLVDVNKQKMKQLGGQDSAQQSTTPAQMSHLERALWNIE